MEVAGTGVGSGTDFKGPSGLCGTQVWWELWDRKATPQTGSDKSQGKRLGFKHQPFRGMQLGITDTLERPRSPGCGTAQPSIESLICSSQPGTSKECKQQTGE